MDVSTYTFFNFFSGTVMARDLNLELVLTQAGSSVSCSYVPSTDRDIGGISKESPVCCPTSLGLLFADFSARRACKSRTRQSRPRMVITSTPKMAARM